MAWWQRPAFTRLLVAVGFVVAAAGFWKFRIIDTAALRRVSLQTLDLYVHHTPMTRYGFEALGSGKVPLWNPYQLCGVPFLATPQTGLFYPGNLSYLWLETPVATELSFVAHLAFAATCLFFLARRLGLSTAGAVAAALTFSWSGWMVFYAEQAPLVSGMCWLPATLLAVDGALHGSRIALLGLALAVAVQLLNGTAEYLVQNLYVAALFVALRLAPAALAGRPRESLGRAVALLGSVIAGLLLAAPQVLPTLELVDLSVRASGGLSVEEAALGAIAPGRFLEEALDGRGIVNTGVLPLLGLALGLGLGLRGPGCAWALGLGAGALAALLVTGGSVFELYFRTPLGGLFRRPEKFLHIFAFAQALLAGVALTRLAAWRAAGTPAAELWRNPLWLVTLALLASALAARAFAGSSGAPLAAALALCLVFGSTSQLRLRGAAIAALLALQAGVLFFGASKTHLRPISNPDMFDIHAGLLEELKRGEGAGRTYLSPAFFRNPSLTPKQGTLRTLHVSTDYEPLATRRHARFFDTAAANGGFLFGRYELGATTRWRMMDLTGTRYYVVRRGSDLDAYLEQAASPRSDFALRHAGRILRVYERRTPLPRALFVPSARVLADSEAVLGALATTDFDPRAEVLLEAPATSRADEGSPARGSARLLRAEPERVEVEVVSDGPGYLLLADTFYPGWRAWANGREVSVLRANYLFRAVPVEAGRTRVEFRYAPESLRLGLWLAAAAGAAMLLLGLAYRRTPSAERF